MQKEFIYQEAPFPQCHASTIAESGSALVAAWFGGTREKHPDVSIWVSRKEQRTDWTAPVEVANGVMSPELRYPCWNPVLFQPSGGPLLLFYKVGPHPSEWWGMMMRSADAGKTWSAPERLPEGILGPIKNKPIERPDGTLICPSSSERNGWRAQFELTPDLGRAWQRVGPIDPQSRYDVIQPTILTHADNRLQALFRSKQGVIVTSWSQDGGLTWDTLTPTDLPNPNSGIDAVTLSDGRQLLVYNHAGITPGQWGGARTPLNVAVSRDGLHWASGPILEDQEGEYSYPAVIQTKDGRVHITYTYQRRRVRHVTLDPVELPGIPPE